MQTDSRSRLRDLFRERAVSLGRFKLASGKESTYYVNSKKAIFNGEAAWLLGDILCQMTRGLNIQAIGGLEVGAIPMGVAAALRCHEEGRHVEAFFVRKQAKDHGSKERVEGLVRKGDRVALVDDVLTTGESAAQAAAAIEELGAQIAVIICIVDRLEGARERLSRYEFRPIFTIRDFGIEPPVSG